MLKDFMVLLVDDEEELIENLTFDLQDDVNSFVVAYDGQSGLKKFTEFKDNLSCIVTDIKMPHMNGLEFIAEVRKVDTEIPVIFLTAHGDEEQMKLALSLNAFDFLNKPYDVFELKEMLITIHSDKEKAVL